ncbi:MAG: hypothetical protein R2911_31250 [Caldilineaceae bacterium]
MVNGELRMVNGAGYNHLSHLQFTVPRLQLLRRFIALEQGGIYARKSECDFCDCRRRTAKANLIAVRRGLSLSEPMIELLTEVVEKDGDYARAQDSYFTHLARHTDSVGQTALFPGRGIAP